MDISTKPSSVRRPRSGFSLVELLVVIAIIALLIALVLVSVSNFQSSARLVQCMSNQHQLQVGLVSFSQDNNGKFMSPQSQWPPPSGFNQGLIDRDSFWVKSYNCTAPTPDEPCNGDRILGSGSDAAETDLAIKEGALWDYIGDLKAFSSPLDPSERVRSYSLNGFISDLPDNPQSNPNAAWGPTVDRISKVRNPSNTFYTIPEQDPGSNYNRGGWVIDLNPSGGRQWKDVPAFWTDDGRYALSFIDGSSRITQVLNPDLPEILTANELPVSTPTELDFEQLAEWLDPTK
ncbi:MAG: hypothetical protein CMJ23_00885 [Phycisphaerae bacterium]|nr:hypothetical protein [Phycisphaerae bacterium]